MCGLTLPLAPMKPDGPIFVDLKQKRKPPFSFFSLPLSSPSLFLSLLPYFLSYPPELPCLLHCHSFYFSVFIFFISLFDFLSPFDACLHVSHSHKCTTWLMPCVTPLGFNLASTCSCHVSPDTRGASKNMKFRLFRNPTKFDRVTRFHEMNSNVKSISSSKM